MSAKIKMEPHFPPFILSQKEVLSSLLVILTKNQLKQVIDKQLITIKPTSLRAC